MEDNFYNPQNIEAYLRGKLSSTDQEIFENEVLKDPLLQNELTLQKDIISSLKEHRKADLKKRLNAIEIKSPWYYSIPVKVAASVTAISIATLVSYFGYNSYNDKKETTVAVVQKTESYSADKINSKIESSDITSVEVKRNAADVNYPSLKSIREVSKEESKKKNIIQEKAIVPAVPPVIDNYNEEVFNPDHTLRIPEGNVVPTDDHKASDIQVQIASTTEHKFHYQFFNNKLFLFCDFTSGPYELLELHNKKSRDLYLFYSGSYYEIKHNQHEVTPLKPIKNSNLIKQLAIIKDK